MGHRHIELSSLRMINASGMYNSSRMTRMIWPDCTVVCNNLTSRLHAQKTLTYFVGDSFAHMCVCVCVFSPFILDIKFVGRTSRGHTGGRSHRIFIHLLSAVRALIFLARRIQPFLSLVDRGVEFCVLTI